MNGTVVRIEVPVTVSEFSDGTGLFNRSAFFATGQAATKCFCFKQIARS